MDPTIPLFQLDALAGPAGGAAAVLFLGPDAGAPHLPLDRPYRSGFYKVGICLRGAARLRVNLDTYALAPGSLVTGAPGGIRQWLGRAADCASYSVFFTREFVGGGGGVDPDGLACFVPGARPVVALPPAAAEGVAALLRTIGERYAAPHPYRTEILRSLLHILLHEVAALHGALPGPAPAGRSRGEQIAADFKRLVSAHAATERGLAFYAGRLCITPKHLAETVRAATGRRAAEWLAEAVLLHAQVLLHQPELPIGQIADQLRFADPSTFGRFFRHHTGLTPAAYRRQR